MPLDSVCVIDLFLLQAKGATEQVEWYYSAVREQSESHSYNK